MIEMALRMLPLLIWRLEWRQVCKRRAKSVRQRRRIEKPSKNWGKELKNDQIAIVIVVVR